MTLVFPDSTFEGVTANLPATSTIPYLNNASAIIVPSSKNILTPISQEKTIAVSMDYALAPSFVQAVRELPGTKETTAADAYGNKVDGKRWMMSAIKGDTAGQQRSFSRRVSDAWTAFVDLLKVNAKYGTLMIWLT